MEFDYFLVTQLPGWRSVEEMRAGMSQAEHLGWEIYYARIDQKRSVGHG